MSGCTMTNTKELYRLENEVFNPKKPGTLLPQSFSRLYIPSNILNLSIVEKITSVVESFTVIYKNKGERLNQGTTLTGYSPLHIAVITDNLEAIELLLDAGADINAQDKYKWTPLHHAALLSHNLIVNLLIARGADTSCRTRQGGTHGNLARLVQELNHPPEALIPLLWEDLSPLSCARFKQLTGSEFLPELSATPQRILEERSDEPIYNSSSVVHHVEQAYLAFLRSPPMKHVLKSVTTDSEGNPLTFSPGQGLFAEEDIPQGTVIGEYSGILRNEDSDPKRNPYLFFLESGAIDAENYRNEMAQINDGFPNVTTLPVYNINGVRERVVFTTLEPIRKGEQFLINYGIDHDVKTGLYIGLKETSAYRFVREFFDSKRLSCFMKFLHPIERANLSFKEYALCIKMSYVLHTPALFFSLRFKEIISEGEGTILQSLFIKQNPDLADSITPLSVDVARDCLKNIEDLSAFFPETMSYYKNYITHRPQERGFLHMLFAIDEINPFLQNIAEQPDEERPSDGTLLAEVQERIALSEEDTERVLNKSITTE